MGVVRDSIYSCSGFAQRSIVAAAEQFHQHVAEAIGGDLAGEHAALGDADVAGLFGDHDDDGVGFLAQSYGGSVAAAEALLEVAYFGEGELHGGVHDAAIADNDAEVMQGGVWIED